MPNETTIPAEVRLGSALDEIEGIPNCWRVSIARDALADLVAERDQLARWKAEALPLLNRTAALAERYTARGDRGRSHLDSIERELTEAITARQRLDRAMQEANADADRYQRERNEAHERIARIREMVRTSARNSLALAELL